MSPQRSTQARAAQEALVRHALACADLAWSNATADPADQLYGLFQCFMPHGEGVAAVFDGLNDPALADALLQRLMPIYASTGEATAQAFASGRAPGYFVPHSANEHAGDLMVALGEQQLARWRTWAQDLGDAELIELLARMGRVELVTASCHSAEVKARREAAPTHAVLHDALSDWWIAQLPADHPVWAMSEAYYSINCDYWVSYHLQAPALAALQVPHMPDLLAPNFALYLRGASLVLTGDALLVTQDNLPKAATESHSTSVFASESTNTGGNTWIPHEH